MEDLSQTARVDLAVKINNIIYETGEKSPKDKVLGYLNQVGLINYNRDVQMRTECNFKKILKLTTGGGDVRRKYAKKLRVLEAEHFFSNQAVGSVDSNLQF
jgi:hypothetical protein